MPLLEWGEYIPAIFYTDVVGISPYAAGAIYGIGILWDAFTDPFMGYVAERTRSKWGATDHIYIMGLYH